MSSVPVDEALQAGLDPYLAALEADLPGRPSIRAAILEELHDGLIESAQNYLGEGKTPPEAARAAIAEFGHPGEVAAAFVSEVAALQARKVALVLLRTGPLMGLLWGFALLTSPATDQMVLRHNLVGWWQAFPLVGLVIVTIVAAALITVAATGGPSRYVTIRPDVALTTAATAGFAVVAGDLAMLGITTAQAIFEPSSLAWVPVTVAATASLARLIVSRRAARQCLTMRAAVIT